MLRLHITLYPCSQVSLSTYKINISFYINFLFPEIDSDEDTRYF